MTIDLSDNNPRINYAVAQGVTQTVFSVPFEFFDDADVTVYVDGVLKTEGTDYTLTGGDGSTGTLTFVTATPPEVQQVTGASGGSTVTLVRHIALERTTDFVAGQDINRAALNEELDTIVGLIADLDDRVDRTIHLSDSEVAPSMLLTEDRKGRVLAFDVTTGDVKAGPLSSDIAIIADNIAEILAADDEATAAASSAAAASSSASSASTSAFASATSASNSASSASAAASSASAASASESNAATSETNAATSETNAATSATNAATSETNAAASASSAQASKDAALAALDSFDDRYLGQKASDPTLDNDGDALVAGALYFNTTDDVMKVYEGSVWVSAYASLSGALLAANNLSDLNSVSAARANLGLGTAATTASTDYATAAQGALADTALQDITGESIEDLSDVASMTPNEGQALVYSSGSWTAADMAGGIAYTRHTSNVTVEANEGVIADTSGGSFTVTLPASPDTGDTVIIVDGADWSVTNLTVARSGSTIEGDAEDMTLDIGGASVQFTYDGTTWQVYTQAGIGGSALVSGDNVSELVNDAGYLTTAPDPFAYNAVSGATQDLDVGSHNFFDGGTLTADTTLTFSNVPTEAKWQYTALLGSIGNPFDISNASYASSFDTSGTSGYPSDFAFKPDGTKLYIMDAAAKITYQFSLSTAWEVSTASYDGKSYNNGGDPNNQNCLSISFNTDGTKVFFASQGYAAVSYADRVYEHTLSTAWDISTASYSTLKDISAQAGGTQSLTFNSDGTKMYITDGSLIYQYTLSTAFSVSTASYDSKSFNFSAQDSTPEKLQLNADGTKALILGRANDAVFQYSLSTAYDISSASYDSVSFDISSEATGNPQGFVFGQSGGKFYIGDIDNDAMYQYDIFETTTLSFPASVQNPPNIDSQAGQQVTFEFFTSDGGTNVYTIGQEAV